MTTKGQKTLIVIANRLIPLIVIASLEEARQSLNYSPHPPHRHREPRKGCGDLWIIRLALPAKDHFASLVMTTKGQKTLVVIATKERRLCEPRRGAAICGLSASFPSSSSRTP